MSQLFGFVHPNRKHSPISEMALKFNNTLSLSWGVSHRRVCRPFHFQKVILRFKSHTPHLLHMCARHSLLHYKVIHHILISETRSKSFKRSFTVHLTVSGCAGMEDSPPEVAANLSWTSLVCTSAAPEALKGQTQRKDLISVTIRKGGCNRLTQPVSPN